MRKVVLVIVWSGNYVLGAAGIYALHLQMNYLAIPLIIASFFPTKILGKIHGIGEQLQKEANATIPIFIDTIWKIVGVITAIVLFLSPEGGNSTSGIPCPITHVQALALFYTAAAIRDSFLIRFYLARTYNRATPSG